ncbi:GTP 3' 8-cyclase [Bienertia sinuspersici]
MDLRATKEKLALPIKSAEYRVGVDDFMVYATRSLTSSDGKLRCPCIKCKRSKRGKESLMNVKVKPISTTGTKSHARVREELVLSF